MVLLDFKQTKTALLFGLAISVTACSEVQPLPMENSAATTVQRPDGGKRAEHRIIVGSSRNWTAESAGTSALLTRVCECSARFIRILGQGGLVYEVTLPDGRTLAEFASRVMEDGRSLGITYVEEDGRMTIQ